jgi:hypothetical protein
MEQTEHATRFDEQPTIEIHLMEAPDRSDLLPTELVDRATLLPHLEVDRAWSDTVAEHR